MSNYKTAGELAEMFLNGRNFAWISVKQMKQIRETLQRENAKKHTYLVQEKECTIKNEVSGKYFNLSIRTNQKGNGSLSLIDDRYSLYKKEEVEQTEEKAELSPAELLENVEYEITNLMEDMIRYKDDERRMKTLKRVKEEKQAEYCNVLKEAIKEEVTKDNFICAIELSKKLEFMME